MLIIHVEESEGIFISDMTFGISNKTIIKNKRQIKPLIASATYQTSRDFKEVGPVIVKFLDESGVWQQARWDNPNVCGGLGWSLGDNFNPDAIRRIPSKKTFARVREWYYSLDHVKHYDPDTRTFLFTNDIRVHASEFHFPNKLITLLRKRDAQRQAEREEQALRDSVEVYETPKGNLRVNIGDKSYCLLQKMGDVTSWNVADEFGGYSLMISYRTFGSRKPRR